MSFTNVSANSSVSGAMAASGSAMTSSVKGTKSTGFPGTSAMTLKLASYVPAIRPEASTVTSSVMLPPGARVPACRSLSMKMNPADGTAMKPISSPWKGPTSSLAPVSGSTVRRPPTPPPWYQAMYSWPVSGSKSMPWAKKASTPVEPMRLAAPVSGSMPKSLSGSADRSMPWP